jgi:hypothetical protein
MGLKMEHENIEKPETFDFLALDRVGLEGNKDEFTQHVKLFTNWIESIPEEILDRRYAVDKWTIRKLLGHIIDSHIVVLYRILSISRGDMNPLPGGNQDLWASSPGYEKAAKYDLLQGYRKAADLSRWLMNWIPEKAMENQGTANGITVSVRGLHIYLIAHERHHQRIAKEKYGV